VAMSVSPRLADTRGGAEKVLKIRGFFFAPL
jgi:hypothetical protein